MRLSKWFMMSGLLMSNIAQTYDEGSMLTVRFAIGEDISGNEQTISSLHDLLTDNIIDPLIMLLTRQPNVSHVSKEHFANQTKVTITADCGGKNKKQAQSLKVAAKSLEDFMQSLLRSACGMGVDIRIVPPQTGGLLYNQEYHVIISKLGDLAATEAWMKKFKENIPL